MNRYQLVHQLAREMRRKLTQQSRELQLERNRRLLAGIAKEADKRVYCPELKRYEAPETENEIELTFDIIESGEIPRPELKPLRQVRESGYQTQ